MSLRGKTMKIGGYNYHVSDQGSGDKVAFLVHGMPGDVNKPMVEWFDSEASTARADVKEA